MTADPILVAATAGLVVEGDTLPNGRPVVPVVPGDCCPSCLVPVLGPDDCNECRNTGLAGPYPEGMAEQVLALGGQQVTVPNADPEPLVGYVLPCPLCHPDAYPGGFPGLTSAIGTPLLTVEA